MRLIKTDDSGQLDPEEINFFGGNFSLFEKIRLGRIGSPKVLYEYGVDHLDLLSRDIEGELTYINFEVLRNGLIIRANCNQRQVILGLRLSDIRSIDLIGKVKRRKAGYEQETDVHIKEKGILRIQRTDLSLIKLNIQSFQYKGIVKFFLNGSLSKQISPFHQDLRSGCVCVQNWTCNESQ